MAEMFGVLTFLGGFMGIVVGVNYAIRWTNRKFPNEGQMSANLAAMEERLEEVEERLDFAERLLTETRNRQELPPR